MQGRKGGRALEAASALPQRVLLGSVGHGEGHGNLRCLLYSLLASLPPAIASPWRETGQVAQWWVSGGAEEVKEESFPDAEARRTSAAWNGTPGTDPRRRDSPTGTGKGAGARRSKGGRGARVRCGIAEEAGVMAEAATRRKAKADKIRLGCTEGSGALVAADGGHPRRR